MKDRTSFGELFVELGNLAFDYRFTCPSYYVLVMRSFVTLEGLAARADPNFNIYSAAVPYAVRRWGNTPLTNYPVFHVISHSLLGPMSYRTGVK